MLTLYYFPGTISVASAIALNEAGAAHDLELVDFKSGAQTQPDYLAINPKGRVPALGTPEGILTETIAILEYIAQTHPEARLMPADPFRAAQVRSVMTWLASTMHVNHAMNVRGKRWASEDSSIKDLKSNVTRNMSACCDLIESELLQGDYVMGAEYSLADPYLFAVTNWLKMDGVDAADYPRLQAFRERMSARPAVEKARTDGVIPT